MRAPRSTSTLVTHLLAFAVVSALALGACGNLKPGDATGSAGSSGSAGTTGTAGTGAAGTSANVHVNISGTAAPHPLNKLLLAEDEDFSMLKVAIVDPSAVIVDPTTPPLGSMSLDTSTVNCDPTLGCAWALAGVDITNLNLGLVGTLEDQRTGTARVWVKTGTGMGSKADLDAVRATPAPITGRRAFAVSVKLTAVLEAFVAKALNVPLNAGDLEARGFLIGHVLDRLSTGAFPAGVAGAKVTATGTGFDVIYPNLDFTATGTTTAADGIFIMVPQTVTSVVSMWSVVPPAGDSRRWTTTLAGSNPTNAFVIVMPANE